jgi:hypothetical protein
MAVGHYLGEIHQYRNEPVMQAIAMVHMWRHCQAFWRNRRNAPVIMPQVTMPAPAPSTGGRQRRNALVPVQGTPVFAEEATRTRALVLDRIETQLLKELCAMLGCDLYWLPNYLEARFSAELSKHGQRTDTQGFQANRLKYLEEAEAAEFKVTFRNGLAYMLCQDKGELRERPADTRSYASVYSGKHRRYCFGYVLTGTDLYMADHDASRKDRGGNEFYHSSYLAGKPVMCAGDISFHEGSCTSISNLSGHYKPKPSQLLSLILFLRGKGLDMGHAQVVLNGDSNSVAELSVNVKDAQAILDPRKLDDDEVGGQLVYRTVEMFLGHTVR